MPNNPEHGTPGTMPLQTAAAPCAIVTGEIDLPDDSPADPACIIRRNHFTHELMSGGAGEAIVTALQFKIGIADASRNQSDQCETPGPARNGFRANLHSAIRKMNGNHHLSIVRSFR